MKTVLELIFKDEKKATSRIVIVVSEEGVSPARTKILMDAIQESDIFNRNGFRPYATVSSARLVETSISQIYGAYPI